MDWPQCVLTFSAIINVSLIQCFIVAEAIADLCLFASLPISHENFQEALNFCLNAASYPKLKSAVEQQSSTITDTNVVLDILKENRDNYKL